MATSGAPSRVENTSGWAALGVWAMLAGSGCYTSGIEERVTFEQTPPAWHPQTLEFPGGLRPNVAGGVALETGYLFGRREQFDVGLRFSSGTPTLYRFAASAAWAFK